MGVTTSQNHRAYGASSSACHFFRTYHVQLPACHTSYALARLTVLAHKFFALGVPLGARLTGLQSRQTWPNMAATSQHPLRVARSRLSASTSPTVSLSIVCIPFS